MALEVEFETYKQKLPTLLHDAGKFVLIHGKDVAGIFDTYGQAVTEGYDRFNLEPFLVKQIQEADKPRYFTRGVRPCLS